MIDPRARLAATIGPVRQATSLLRNRLAGPAFAGRARERGAVPDFGRGSVLRDRAGELLPVPGATATARTGRGSPGRWRRRPPHSRLALWTGGVPDPRRPDPPAGCAAVLQPGEPDGVDRSALDRRLSAITTPFGVVGAFLVHALVGVRTKEVPLSLDQGSRQPLCTNAVVVGQR